MEIFLFMVCDSWYWPCPMQGFCHFNFLTRSFGKWQSSLHIEGLCGGHFTTSCLCGRFLFGLPQPSLQFFERCETSQSCSLSRSPVWNLPIVLESLCQSPFEPLEEVDLRWKSLKAAFLLALASTKWVGELHALSVSQSCMRWKPEGTGVTLWPNPAFLPKVLLQRCCW